MISLDLMKLSEVRKAGDRNAFLDDLKTLHKPPSSFCSVKTKKGVGETKSLVNASQSFLGEKHFPVFLQHFCYIHSIEEDYGYANIFE